MIAAPCVRSVPMMATTTTGVHATQRMNETATLVRVEELVVALAVELAHSDADSIDAQLASSLARVGEEVGVDSLALLQFDPDKKVHVGRAWSRAGAVALPGASLARMSETVEKLQRGELVHIESLELMPADLLVERPAYEQLGLDAFLALPLRVGRETLGALMLGWSSERRGWSDRHLRGMRAVAALFATALARLRELARRGAEVATGTLADIDRAHILAVLRACNWVVAGPHGAASRLGMKRSTLNFRMHKLGISRER
jgi:transcriptional regulator with GAF, ATPase, and Fis domain